MRSLVISLLLVIATTACGAPISNQLDSLRIAVFSQLNLNSGGSTRITTSVANYALNRASLQVCTDFPAIEKLDTVTIGISSEGGTLNTDFNRLYKVFKIVDSVRLPCTIVNPDTLEKILPDRSDNVQDLDDDFSPRYVYSFGGLLMAHPKQMRSVADSFLVYYYANDTQMSADGDSCHVRSKYLEKVILYASAILSGTRKIPADVALFMQMYQGSVPLESEEKK